jgi:hypothetical protein
MNLSRVVYLFSLLIFSSVAIVAQTPRPPKGGWEMADAEEHFKHQNYLMALPIYKELLKQKPKDPEIEYKIGVCYIRTNINHEEAIKYLEDAVTNPKLHHPDVWFFLGKTYHLAGKYDKAIETFKKYKEVNAKDKQAVEKAELHINQCNNAKELIKYPIHVQFTNCGPEINSQYPDYYPFVTADEQMIFFTSRRKGQHASQAESDGYFASDVLYSNVLDGKWDVIKNLGSQVNTTLDEEVVGINPDGSELVIYIDHIDKVEDLYTTRKKPNGYGKLEMLSKNVSDAKEYSGSISHTEEGDVLVFARKDANSLGGTDIYQAKRLPNGMWALPMHLGNNVNTKYNEDFPMISMDGKTLYFSSEGHSSMGGYDLFKSQWDEEKMEWGTPTNLGYPLNTPDDERQISILPDHRAGYVCALRPGGYGDLDIYRVKFEDEEQKLSIFRGNLIRSDSLKTEMSAMITALNTKTNEELTFVPNSSTGRYIMALLPGKYKITITCDGYKELKDDIIIFDFGIAKPETVKDYTLLKN